MTVVKKETLKRDYHEICQDEHDGLVEEYLKKGRLGFSFGQKVEWEIRCMFCLEETCSFPNLREAMETEPPKKEPEIYHRPARCQTCLRILQKLEKASMLCQVPLSHTQRLSKLFDDCSFPLIFREERCQLLPRIAEIKMIYEQAMIKLTLRKIAEWYEIYYANIKQPSSSNLTFLRTCHSQISKWLEKVEEREMEMKISLSILKELEKKVGQFIELLETLFRSVEELGISK